MDRTTILDALTATGWNITRAAKRLGTTAGALAYHMKRQGIQRPNVYAPRREEQHPPAAAIVAEMDALRLQARLLVRSYGHCHHRIHELRRLEARHRELRAQLRKAMGPAEATDTRGKSLAGFGLVHGARGSWEGQR